MADLSYGSPATANGSQGERLPFSAIPKRWPLVTTDQHRSAETSEIEKDARLVNCYAELEPMSGDYQIEKRPGLGSSVAIGANGDIGLGMFSWNTIAGGSAIYSIFNNKVYRGVVAFAGTVNTQGSYRFEIVGVGAAQKLAFGNGFDGYYTDGVNVTHIVDVDFPSDFCRGFAYLDGTLYVMRIDGGIQGSAIDDPANWDPLNLVFARSAPGDGVALIRHLTYVVALKTTSTEAFYDAGNPTGSPLSRVDGGFIAVGCRSADSVGEVDGMHFWLSLSNQSKTLQIVKLENLQISVVSTPPIERVLTKFMTVNNSIQGYCLKIVGHRFYIITELSAAFALVYDIDQKLWYQWYSVTNWPFVSAAPGVVTTNFFQWIQHTTTGKVYQVDSDYVFPNDDGTLFPVDIYTPNVDFGIRRKKSLNAIMINADQTRGSELLVRSSEDDYTNWTNFRKVNLGLRQPILSGLGSFFKRAYNFRHFKNTSFRIQSVDLQMDLGTF